MDRRLGLLALGIAGLACAGCANEPPARAWRKPHSKPVGVPRDAAPIATRPDAKPVDPQVAAGTGLWGKYCALCHGPKAMGYAADHAPSLVTTTFLESATDDFLRAGIIRGRPGTPMGGYGRLVGGPLDDNQVTQLIAFLRNGAPAPVTLATAPIKGDAARGAAVFKDNCEKCHGTPDAAVDAVQLANPMFLDTASDQFLRYAIANGRPGTKMVAFTGTLPDADIDAVVAYLRSLAKAVPKPTPVVDPTATPPDKVVLNPKGKPPDFTLREDRFVPAEEVKKALDGKRKFVILDARSPADWIRMHIPGAIAAPYYDLTRLDAMPTDGTWIIAYCACPHHASGIVVDELRKRGITHSAILDEGILVWQKLGYPVVDADGKKVTAPTTPPTIKPAQPAPPAKAAAPPAAKKPAQIQPVQ